MKAKSSRSTFHKRRLRAKKEEIDHGQSMNQVRQRQQGDALSKRPRFWIPSWPTRAANPKIEKPMMFVRRDMVVAARGVDRSAGVVAGGGGDVSRDKGLSGRGRNREEIIGFSTKRGTTGRAICGCLYRASI